MAYTPPPRAGPCSASARPSTAVGGIWRKVPPKIKVACAPHVHLRSLHLHSLHCAGTRMEIDEEKETIGLKVVLLGEVQVGKTSVVLRFTSDSFNSEQESTMGAAFSTKSIELGDKIVRFDIWDTAGQERYHSLAPMYYRDAVAAIVCYDITNVQTFEKAKEWIRELQINGTQIICLSGNKCDLPNRQIPTKDAETYAEDMGCHFFETSALNNSGITEMFMSIAHHIPTIKTPISSDHVVIDRPRPPPGGRSCC
ncbi:putative Ras-related protein RABF2b [Paratrimastix pyriformis]|uniref:Ras-related protein RABF2b n=1 Tax=Paratrimastix pyriformis TaxID=342808 RepID=A0ABQ8UWW9_9EUKA|nr:putative Ras-related protein RABF2b [Paratrimastix pyriformis]